MMRAPTATLGLCLLFGCATPSPEPEVPAAVLPAAVGGVSVDALDVLAARIRTHEHNIANAHTPAFKSLMLHVEEQRPDVVRAPGLQQNAMGAPVPAGLELGSGARLLSSTRCYTQGALEFTSRKLDVAIDGAGFFQVLLPSGETGYTRDGSFAINADGKLVTQAGHLLQPEVALAQDVVDVAIDAEGRVTVRTQGNSSVQQIAQIQLAKFINPEGLLSRGGNIVLETDASGRAITGNPGSNGLGSLEQSFREASNVNLHQEMMSLSEARREYDMLWQLLWAKDRARAAPGR